MSTVDLTDKQVMEKFAAFEERQDPTLVHEALDIVEGVERDVTFADAVARKRALSLRLAFMAALERNIDPNWDSTKVPVKGVTPPPTEGVVYGTGEVDPSTILDPNERAEYERALKASKEYERWYDVQFELRRIDARSIRFMEVWLNQNYQNSETDRREIDQLIETSGLGDVRKDQMRTLAYQQRRNDSPGPDSYQ
jgi:hypothetical protein